MNAVESIQSKDVVAPGTSKSERNGDKDPTEEAEKSQNERNGKEKAKEVKSARVMYSLEELLALRGSPASKLWPSVLAEEYVRDGLWDPEMWHQSLESSKRCASPVEDIRRQVIKEDGIVLSPQRQSFGQGCHAPHSAPERGSQQDRIKSMIGRSADRERDGRSRLTGRVGRGRSSDYLERTPPRDRNRDPNELRRPGPRDRELRDREHRERPPRDRDLRDRFDRGDHQDRPKRSRDEDSYNKNNRGRSKTVEEEPEWFAHGPTSQFETIELKGFDQEENKRRQDKARKPENGEMDISTPKSSNSPLLEDGTSATKTNTNTSHNAATEEENVKDDDGKGFDINQFFMSETILPFSAGIEQVSSRFSQFFGSGSRSCSRSNSRTGSRRSSIADDFIEFSGYSSPRPASPAQEFMFTPITPPPVELDTDPEVLANILQKTKINVKPLLDSVLSSGVEQAKVKGELHLEDIEAELESKRVVDQKNKENLEHIKEPTDLTAFNMLVETMKTTGSLPEKPSPVIPGLPSHLLPTPPSPKRKTPCRTPSPSFKGYQRCLSPAELMKQVAIQASLPVQRPPSPAQVVPQMERSLSPFGMRGIATPPQDLFGSPVLRRSPSPLSMLAQRRPVPLLGPNAFGAPVLYAHQSPNPPPGVVRPTPQPAKLLGRTPGMQQRRHDVRTGRQNEPTTPKSAPPQTAKGSPSLTSMSFMPTSVMKKMHNQKTPKGSNNDETRESKDSTASPVKDSPASLPQQNTQQEHGKGQDNMNQMEIDPTKYNRSTEFVNGSPERSKTGEPRQQMSPVSQLRQQLARHEPSVMDDRDQQHNVSAPDQRQNSQTSELHAALLSPRQCGQQEAREKKAFSPVLQQPSAFRPPGLSPHANSSIRPDGSHSEPQTPYHGIGSSPLKQPPRALPNSAPCTPQRHPLANSAALLSRNQTMEHGAARPSTVKDNWIRELPNDHQQGPLQSDTKPQFTAGYPVGPPAQNGPSQQDSKRTLASPLPPRRNSFEGHFEHPRQQDSFRRPMPVGEMKQNLTPQEMNQYRMRQESLMHRQGSAFAGGRASPPMVHPMQGLPPRSQFMSPYGPMPMSPQGAMHHGLVGPGMSPAYLARYGMVSPGMASRQPVTPNQPGIPVPHPAARYPMVPSGQAPFLYGPRPSPSYPPINPTAMMSPHPQVHPMRMAPQFMAGGRASPSSVAQRHDPSPQSVREPADSNPLTKWFSADVLKQATPRAPAVPDVSRKMLSVEELERQQTAVHN